MKNDHWEDGDYVFDPVDQKGKQCRRPDCFLLEPVDGCTASQGDIQPVVKASSDVLHTLSPNVTDNSCDKNRKYQNEVSYEDTN